MNGKIHIDNPRNTLSVIAEGEGGTYTLYMSIMLKFVMQFGYHNKEDSDEVLQKMFYKIWTYSSQITGIACLGPYVDRMTKNLLYDGFSRLGVMKESDESIKENKNRLSHDHGLSSGWFIFYFNNLGYFKFQ